MTFVPSANEFIESNKIYSEKLHNPALKSEPKKNVAVVCCMDARIDVHSVLGLENGEAHIMRNAGGVVTDDVIRSLCLSQRSLGTKEIVLLHHTKCGLKGVDEAAFREDLAAELGVRPSWALETFTDPYDDVRQSIKRLEMSPFVPHKEYMRGFVYDVTSGLLNEV